MPVISLSEFKTYLQAFNARDYEVQHSFYDENVTLKLPTVPLLEGKAAIVSQYKAVHPSFDEAIIPLDILINDHRIIILKRTVFGAREDTPDFLGQPLKKGDVVVFAAYIHYEFNEYGKIIRINLTGYEEEDKPALRFLGKTKSFKQVVDECLEDASEDFGIWSWDTMKGTAYL
jgi:hypothetical protein